MILVCGALIDRIVAYTCVKFEQMDFDYFFLDELKYPNGFEISWVCKKGRPNGYIKLGSKKIELSELTGIFVRHISPDEISTNANNNSQDARIIKSESIQALDSMVSTIPCVVVNRSFAQLSNSSKPYQSLLIRQFGFKTPKTLVTNIPSDVKSFYDYCEGRIIYKSTSGVRSIVQRFRKEDFARLELIKNCATQFQEYIDGYDIRVHIVGNALFATKVISEATDYRYASQEGFSVVMEPIKLPDRIEKMCLELSNFLGLVMAGIDLRRTPRDEYYCLEVNPSPGYVYYELGANQPISESLARVLNGDDPLPKI